MKKVATNTYECCAERNLIRQALEKGRRKGVRAHEAARWLRRKFGGDMTVWRYRADGSLGCSVPCALCRPVLQRFGFRVHAVTQDSAWFHGYLQPEPEPEPEPERG